MVKLPVVLLALAIAAETSRAQAPNMFPSKDACTSALNSGNVTFYQPKFFGLHGKQPVNGTTTRVIPLEGNTCVHMLTAMGWRWVAQQTGTAFRWHINPDGSLGAIYARDDCGNPVDAVAFVETATVTVSIPRPEPALGPPGHDGLNGKDGISPAVQSVPVGDPNCPYGGTRFIGPNGTSYACNAQKGEKGDQGPRGKGASAWKSALWGFAGGLVAAGLVEGVEALLKKKDVSGPAVTSDSTKIGPKVTSDSVRVCTGVPCPGANPYRGSTRTWGLILDPRKKEVGLRFAFPFRP